MNKIQTLNTYIWQKVLLVAWDEEAIDPDTKKTIFFGALITSKGAIIDAGRKNAPKIIACFWGAMSKLWPEAA